MWACVGCVQSFSLLGFCKCYGYAYIHQWLLCGTGQEGIQRLLSRREIVEAFLTEVCTASKWLLVVVAECLKVYKSWNPIVFLRMNKMSHMVDDYEIFEP